METTDLTVITLTRGMPQVVSMCLSHLELQTYPSAKFEVIVVTLPSAENTEPVQNRSSIGGPVRMRYIHAQSESAAAARNLAVMQAQGRWLLFLDENLLAGSHLIENHIEMQRVNGDACAVVGRIDYHPQLEARTLPKACMLTDGVFQPGQPLSFLDWRAHNLSLPRDKVLETGGFSEALPFGGLEDIELAYRLETGLGMRGYFCDRAQAFRWKPEPISQGERRYYAEGFWLHHLVKTTEEESLRERYKAVISAWRGWVDSFSLVLARRLCPILAPNSWVCNALRRGVFRSAFRRGFRDARHHSSPALPAEELANGSQTR